MTVPHDPNGLPATVDATLPVPLAPLDLVPANGHTPAGDHDHPPVLPHVIVLFGATGDLARRKLLPGLFHLSRAGLLPECRIVATSLEDLEDHQYHALARSACDEFARGEVAEDHWHHFRERISYVPGVTGPTGLARAVEHAETALGGEPRHLHYLSIPPHAAAEVVQTLDDARLTSRARVIMEKPFGTDLAAPRR